MPSRRTIALIFLFWFLTTGYVAYRDLWPRLFASGPPPVAIDLADEAAQTIPVRWTIYRGNLQVGRLNSHISYVKDDDTFRFTNEYKQLELEIISGVKFIIPELTTIVRITRGGDLREQSLDGKLEAYLLGFKRGEGTAKIRGTVTDGQLIAECDVKSTLWDFKQTLDPVPVPKGQPLNPLQPINRLANLKPGLSWYVQISSPLDDAIDALARKLGIKVPDIRGPLFAQVMDDNQNLDWHGHMVPCWVIEYRQNEPVARTWVRVSDGKVLKQEAFRSDEKLTIERDEY